MTDTPKPTRGGAREGAGRLAKSPTGERRKRANWTIAPSAAARVKAVAEAEGVSASDVVERWAMSLTSAGSPPHSSATTDGTRSPDARGR